MHTDVDFGMNHFYTFQEDILTIRHYLISVIFLLIVTLSAPNYAKAAESEPVPDIVILVLSGVLPTPYDAVSVTYNSKISKEQAHADLKTLSMLGGWQAKASQISTVGGTTGSEFQALGIVKWDLGVLPIEPFVRAFKRYKNIKLHFIVKGAFPFKSLRNYSDEYVDISFSSTYETYIYTIKIKNPNFDKLNLPIIVTTETQKNSPANTEQPAKKSGIAKWLIALAAGIAVGIIAFLIVNKINQLRKE